MAAVRFDSLFATFAGARGERYTLEARRDDEGAWAGECKELLGVEVEADSLDDLLDAAADAITEQGAHLDASWTDVVRAYLEGAGT